MIYVEIVGSGHPYGFKHSGNCFWISTAFLLCGRNRLWCKSSGSVHCSSFLGVLYESDTSHYGLAVVQGKPSHTGESLFRCEKNKILIINQRAVQEQKVSGFAVLFWNNNGGIQFVWISAWQHPGLLRVHNWRSWLSGSRDDGDRHNISSHPRCVHLKNTQIHKGFQDISTSRLDSMCRIPSDYPSLRAQFRSDDCSYSGYGDGAHPLHAFDLWLRLWYTISCGIGSDNRLPHDQRQLLECDLGIFTSI